MIPNGIKHSVPLSIFKTKLRHGPQINVLADCAKIIYRG